MQRIGAPERLEMRDTKVRFELTIHGGEADQRGVSARSLARIFLGISQDIVDVCRNISPGDPTPWAERERSSAVFVVGEIERGNSITAECEVGTETTPWGAQSASAYLAGVAKLRSAHPKTPDLPRGFDRAILERIAGYHEQLSVGNSELLLKPVGNGVAPVAFDATLDKIVKSKLFLLPEEPEPGHAEQDSIYGYEVQGVLYELNDMNYADPSGDVSFEIDAQDGYRWVCTLSKKELDSLLEPHKVSIQDLWRCVVVVTGDAVFRPQKPKLRVHGFEPLRPDDPRQALRNLAAAVEGLEGDLSLQELIDQIRPRE